MTETFTHRGRTFHLRVERDDAMGEPWREHDGHGIVSDWTTRAKKAGERILVEDRAQCRYYDVAGTQERALKDGWGCSHPDHTHATTKETAACAVERDFQHLRGWCHDDWFFAVLGVRLDGEGVSQTNYLGGVEYGLDNAYVLETARELADEIMARVEVDEPDVQLSEN